MRLALQQAALAAEVGEVPIGAVIVLDDTVIGKAHNQVEMLKDPTAHAEMIAITQAASAVGDWRLDGSIIYVTRRPCTMCMGAIALGRMSKVIYGTTDPDKPHGPYPGRQVEMEAGLLEDECTAMLQSFFKAKRLNAQKGTKTEPED